MNKSKTIDFIEAQIKQFIESRRPPIEIRDQADFGYTYANHTLEIFEIRPKWDNPDEIMHSPLAKARYFKSTKKWKLYWMRASGKWVSYEPAPEVKETDKMLKIIGEDSHGCFWG